MKNNAPQSELNTSMMLALHYKRPIITLEEAVRDWLPHLNPTTANRRAKSQTLPFPTFRAEKSKQSPYLVNVESIAQWLDEKQQEATHEWRQVNL